MFLATWKQAVASEYDSCSLLCFVSLLFALHPAYSTCMRGEEQDREAAPPHRRFAALAGQLLCFCVTTGQSLQAAHVTLDLYLWNPGYLTEWMDCLGFFSFSFIKKVLSYMPLSGGIVGVN